MKISNTGAVRPWKRFLPVAVAVVLSLEALSSFAAGVGDLSASALAQIQALQQEKASFTPAQQKMDSQLVFAVKRSRGQAIANGAVPQLRSSVKPDANGNVKVDISGSVTPALLAQIKQAGGTVLNSTPAFKAIRASVPLSQVEGIAALADVQFIRPAVPYVTDTGTVDSEGDVTHRADTARSNFGVDGSGVKVGVISDSVDFLAQSQASGDLGVVNVLPGQSGVPASGEGTAMLEIVHDIAPGAELYFATANGGPATFAQNIINLRAAGCDIIVDDIHYATESPFQDGIVAQAVNTVTESGALYFASAGNEGNLDSGMSGTWEGDFADGGAVGSPVDGKGGNIHSFGAQTYDTVTVPGNYTLLFWSDPLGASTNDYDIYVLDETGVNVVDSSITVQNGTQDPFEMVFPFFDERLVVVKAAGDARFLHIDTVRGQLSLGTAGNMRGHNSSTNAFAVGAVDVHTAFPNPFSGRPANPVESFSSDGPRRMFYRPDGTPVTSGNYLAGGGLVLQKPDIAAADGVSTTLPPYTGLNPFFGTSAAAPHAASIAALLKSYNPDLTAAEIRTVLTNSALDIMTPGVDRDSGVGIVMAYQALQLAPLPLPRPRLLMATNFLSGGNGNGVIDFNECNNLDLVLTNVGRAAATGIRATITSVTPGVIIAQKTSAFSDLDINGGATNITTFKISTTPQFSCGIPVDLTVDIKCDQGSFTSLLRFQTGQTASPIRFDNNVPVPIPDGDLAGTNSTIVVSNITTALMNVSVGLDISHTYDSDLTLRLVGPDGTTVTLSQYNGGNGDNYGLSCLLDANRTFFDDSAATSIRDGIPPFVGIYRPQDPLSAFNGKTGTNVNGAWKLEVVDDLAADVGVIQCWSLILSPASCIDGGGQCPGTDLGLTITPVPEPVIVGNPLTYMITVTNAGPDTANPVSFNQSLPASTTFVSANASQGTVGQAGGTVVGNLGSLQPGQSATVSVVVLPLTVGTIFSTATVGGLQPDFETGNNTVTVASHVSPPSADLNVSLVASPDPALLGGVLTYTVAVTNAGPSLATSVVVSNLLPASVNFLSANATKGTVASTTSGALWTVGSLAKGSFAIATIQVRVSSLPSVVGTIAARAVVSAHELDPVPGNNTVTRQTQITPASDLLLTMTGNPASAIYGSNVTYQINVLNFGPSTAANVSVSDAWPAGTALRFVTVSQGTYATNGNILGCNLGNLTVGASASVTLVVDTSTLPPARIPSALTNSAVVTSDQADSNVPNNSAVVLTRVDYPTNRIVAAGSTLVSESFAPADGAIAPGETVTVNLGLQNIGNINGGTLTATLLAGGGVATNSVQTQNYGVLQTNALPTFKPFTFTASGTNGGAVTATLQLQDGATILPPAVFTFALPAVSRFANTNIITITNVVGPADPYPSTITVSGLTNPVGKVAVTISNFTHTFSDDVSILLVGPGANAQKVLLESHVGGNYGVIGQTVTFDDLASNNLSAPISSGTYKPTSNGTWPTNNPAGPYSSVLSAFNGANPNGTWSLYVYDSADGDGGYIANGWSLAITTIKPVNQVADLAVSGFATPSTVLAGASLTYLFTITNNGPNAATGVAFTNVLPAGVTFVSASSLQGVATTNFNGAVYCNFTNSLPAGATATVSVVVSPNPGVTSISSVAAVKATETDLNTANNSTTVSTVVHSPTSDLAVAMVAAPNSVVVGSNLTYSITVTNNGPDIAYGVVVTNQLPPGLTFIPGLSSSTAGVVTNVAGVITCNVGNLVSGAGALVTVAVTPVSAGSITNVSGVQTISVDTNMDNDSAVVVVTASSPSPAIVAAGATLLAESFYPANKSVDPGETVTVSLALANAGSLDTANLVATLQAANGVTPATTQQTYGALAHGGAAISRSFTFTGNGAGGGVVTAALQLQDGTNNLGTVNFTFNLPSTNGFSNTGAIVIPQTGPASPYPSTINVSGLTGIVSKVSVVLSNVSHAFPDDVDILLVSPSGRKTLLLSDAGGAHAITNLTLAFDAAAATGLPDADTLVSGTFLPTDFEPGDFFTSPAPFGPYIASLDALNGADPNGTWSLYVFDDSTGDAGSIGGGWSLSIVTISPVNGIADLAVGVSNPAGQVNAGNSFAYTISVTNQGPATATGVTVTNLLPAGFSFVTASASGGFTNLNGTVTLFLGDIPVGASGSATLTALAVAPGVYTNIASVFGNEVDFNLADNTARVSTAVGSFVPASLGGVVVHPDGTFTLTLTGQPGQTYVIQASTNLVDWVNVSTNTASALGKFEFTDDDAGNFPRRFYRASLQPLP